MQKVLYVIGSLSIGGAEKQLYLLAGNVKAAGFKTTVFAIDPTGPLYKSFQESGIKVIGIKSYRFRSKYLIFIKILKAYMKLALLILRERPDVIHCYLPLTNFLGATLGRLLGVGKVVTSKRALNNHVLRYPFMKHIDRLADWCSDHILANSQAVLEDTVKLNPATAGKIQVIYNGLQANPYYAPVQNRQLVRKDLGLSVDKVSLISVGNLIPYKGHAELIAAFAQVSRLHKNLHLYIVGQDRGIGDELQAQTLSLGIQDCVSFLGLRQDVQHLLSAMDIFVLPSHEEGFCNALLEAMAAGLPCIATNVGGNAEAVIHNKSGLIVEPKDKAALRDALCQLVEDEGLRLRLAQEAYKASGERFSIKSMLQNHLDIYNG